MQATGSGADVLKGIVRPIGQLVHEHRTPEMIATGSNLDVDVLALLAAILLFLKIADRPRVQDAGQDVTGAVFR